VVLADVLTAVNGFVAAHVEILVLFSAGAIFSIIVFLAKRLARGAR
jgi:hypothetical protein